jgi:hypothetical protein
LARSTAVRQRRYAGSRSPPSAAGSNRRSSRQVAAQLVGRGPHAGAEAGQEGAPEPGGLEHRRALDRHAQLVGLQLQQQAVGRGAAVDPQRRGPRQQLDTSRTSKAMASSVARTRWARVVPRVMPTMVPRAAGPSRGAEAGQCRHEDDAAGVRHGRRQRLGLGGRADDAQPVAQPLHGRTVTKIAPSSA